VCLERASRAVAGAGGAALDVECGYGGVSAGLCGGDAAGGGASLAPRAATANAMPSAALRRVEFPDTYRLRTATMIEDFRAEVGVLDAPVGRVAGGARLDNLQVFPSLHMPKLGCNIAPCV
jgi:hypothetical protein